jgi:hypothetical protein
MIDSGMEWIQEMQSLRQCMHDANHEIDKIYGSPSCGVVDDDDEEF